MWRIHFRSPCWRFCWRMIHQRLMIAAVLVYCSIFKDFKWGCWRLQHPWPIAVAIVSLRNLRVWKLWSVRWDRSAASVSVSSRDLLCGKLSHLLTFLQRLVIAVVHVYCSIFVKDLKSVGTLAPLLTSAAPLLLSLFTQTTIESLKPHHKISYVIRPTHLMNLV